MRIKKVIVNNAITFLIVKIMKRINSLMGENGAGKSTLIKVFTGVIKKDEGEMVFDGKSVCTSPISKITKLEMVSKMIGRDASNVMVNKKKYDKSKINEEVLLERKNLKKDLKVRGQNIKIKKGEVIGFAGLP